ncbi:MAG: phosphonate ABC transporter substrate-binding protein [Anaerolineaceae bacterium]|nr:phosphonate ABC transporter substrate-binding protein [Anaerolineaceae bacterium]
MRYLWCLFLVLVIAGCNSTQAPTSEGVSIDLASLQPLPVRYNEGVVPLRVSVAAVVSPRGTAESYQLLLNYLSETLDRPVELVQRRTYQETNDLVESGEVDVAFVCTSAYITGHDQFGMELLAGPEVSGESVYYSLLIVPSNSSAETLQDLQNKVFAFTDPISYSGRVYPTYLVQQLGHTPDSFFSRTFFTYSHDEAIYAVADGLADGAAVDSLVYDFALERDVTLAERVRVIHRSPPFGIPPVVVSPNVRPQQQALLQEVLLTMHETQQGREALQALGLERFILIEDSAYDSARQITEIVGSLIP